jgi:hypothetical protein
MACTSCKQKRNLDEKFKESASFVPKGVIVFTIIWSCLAIYGLITLISKFL